MKRWIAIILATVIAATLMTGCGKTPDVSDETPEEESTSDNGKLESGDITLTVWSGKEDQELIKTIADKFIAEHKDEANITIKWSEMQEGECRSALLGDILNGPDVYTTTDGEVRTLAAGGGAAEVINVEDVKKNNLESAVEAMTIGGKVYGYPITADNGYLLYYNKKYFSDSDITNLQNMLDVAAKEGKKVAMDWSSGWYLYSFFGMTGLSIGLNEDGVTNYCDWNSTDKEINGVDVVKSLMDIAANPGFISIAQDDWIEAINAGEVIAVVSGIWDATKIEAAWGENFGASSLPKYTCAGKEVQMASFFGYKLIGVNPYSEHVAWAQELAQYISNAENQKLRFEMRGQVPANNEAAATPAIKQSVAIQAMLEQSKYSILQRIGGNYWGAMTNFGKVIVDGNPQNLELQQIIDNAVAGITDSTV